MARTIHDAIASMRSAGISEYQLVARVVETLGNVTAEEVEAVLAENRTGPATWDKIAEERRTLDEFRRLLANDSELACAIIEGIRLQLEALPDWPDPESEARRQARRLRDLDRALSEHLGIDPWRPPDDWWLK